MQTASLQVFLVEFLFGCARGASLLLGKTVLL
jgi:hypothetical protein